MEKIHYGQNWSVYIYFLKSVYKLVIFKNIKCEISDITKAREDLDADHYAMTDVKKRILEYLAVRQLKNSLRGPILCFVGPPGVGKTSIGKSIANTLGRKFHRYKIYLKISSNFVMVT